MKVPSYLKVLALFIAFASIGCTQNKAPIRLATYTYATNDRLKNIELLSLELESQLQRPVQTKSYPDIESFIEGIKSNEVDIALINTLGYLILSLDNEHMLPLANMHIEKDAVDNYKTVLLSANDGIEHYSSIEDQAETLSMMFVKEGSTSGNLVPRLFLSAINIPSPESQFKEVKYGGNHTSTFEKLLKGETDLCAIGSNEFYKQIEADPALMDKVKLLWTSNEIPLGPILTSRRFSEEEQALISGILLNLHEKKPEAFNAIKAGWSEAKQADKFQLVSDEYYDSFRKMNGNGTHLQDILEMFEY